MSNERKLVEALNNFMNNTVVPAIPKNHPALNEWKFLTGILNNAPIQYHQLDFYLHMSNKNTPKTPQTPKSPELQTSPDMTGNKGQYFSDFQNKNAVRYQNNNAKKTIINSAALKKNIVSTMANIHNMMVKNQEHFQALAKKDSSSTTTTQLNSSISTPNSSVSHSAVSHQTSTLSHPISSPGLVTNIGSMPVSSHNLSSTMTNMNSKNLGSRRYI